MGNNGNVGLGNYASVDNNFATAPEFATALDDQLADVRVLRDDAAARSWDAEVARHERVITSIEGHTRRLRATRASPEVS